MIGVKASSPVSNSNGSTGSVFPHMPGVRWNLTVAFNLPPRAFVAEHTSMPRALRLRCITSRATLMLRTSPIGPERLFSQLQQFLRLLGDERTH
jgi:hypothetical protein